MATMDAPADSPIGTDSFSNARKHSQVNKERAFEDEDGMTDCPDSPRGCEKCGLGFVLCFSLVDQKVVQIFHGQLRFLG